MSDRDCAVHLGPLGMTSAQRPGHFEGHSVCEIAQAEVQRHVILVALSCAALNLTRQNPVANSDAHLRSNG